jgi:hypothetical protein
MNNRIHSPHTLFTRNRQHSLSQPHTASLRTPATNLGSGLYTASLGGGVALAPSRLLTRLLTNMRLIAVNWGML